MRELHFTFTFLKSKTQRQKKWLHLPKRLLIQLVQIAISSIGLPLQGCTLHATLHVRLPDGGERGGTLDFDRIQTLLLRARERENARTHVLHFHWPFATTHTITEHQRQRNKVPSVAVARGRVHGCADSLYS